MKRSFRLLVPLFAVIIAPSCYEGGSNDNAKGPGNQPGGVAVALGEIAVDAGGRYFLSRSGTRLVVGDLSTQFMRTIDKIENPSLVAFWSSDQGSGIYTISHQETSETVVSYDLEHDSIVWEITLDRTDESIEVSPAGDKLVLWRIYRDLVVLDASNGSTIFQQTFEDGIADIDLLRDGRRMMITSFETRDAERRPSTQVRMLDLDNGDQMCVINVPNCSSNLVITNEDKRALLAPTRCGRDPVSVIEIDEEDCDFRINLPGFGPVALSPDGDIAVAFIDRDANDPDAPALPEKVVRSLARYHLMFIDPVSLEYETSELGDVLPRYAFTPNGASLLIDTDDYDRTEAAILILDIEEQESRMVTGDDVALDNFVLTPDSEHAFIIDRGLYDLEIDAARTSKVALDFSPKSINMTPDGKTLLLKAELDGDVRLFDVESRGVVGRFVTALAYNGT